MTNFEKYKDDLMKIKERFGVDKNTKEIVKCSILDCEDCILNEKNYFESDKIE